MNRITHILSKYERLKSKLSSVAKVRRIVALIFIVQFALTGIIAFFSHQPKFFILSGGLCMIFFTLSIALDYYENFLYEHHTLKMNEELSRLLRGGELKELSQFVVDEKSKEIFRGIARSLVKERLSDTIVYVKQLMDYKFHHTSYRQDKEYTKYL